MTMTVTSPPHFMVTELVARFGSSAASTIDTHTHKFAVVVMGVIEARFSTLDCAESTANHYYKELHDAFMRRSDMSMAGRVREFVHIKNMVNRMIYRREDNGFWEAEKGKI